jgi:putative membrane protein
MSFIIQILIDAAVIVGLAKFLPKIEIKNFGTALVAALVIAILNVLIGWLLRSTLNIVTLGLLTSVVQLVVTAVMIKITDKLMSGFNVNGFVPALIIAVAIAVVNYLLGTM